MLPTSHSQYTCKEKEKKLHKAEGASLMTCLESVQNDFSFFFLTFLFTSVPCNKMNTAYLAFGLEGCYT